MENLRLARPTTLLVPSLIVFSVMPRKTYYERFVQGRGYQYIALPLIEASGLYFPYTIEGKQRTGHSLDEIGTATEQRLQLADVVRYFQSKGLGVYFTIEMSMPRLSMESGACDLQDQVGKRAAHCCIANPLTQNYVSNLLTESIGVFKDELGKQLLGVVIYVNNNWPMSAQTGRFLLTCFCTHCVQGLKDVNASLDPDWFRGFPNAINLALAESVVIDDDGDEMGGISPVTDIKSGMEPDALLDACSQVRGTQPAVAYDKGNFETQRPLFIRWARQLMLYLDAKSELTAGAIKEIFDACRRVDPNARRVIIAQDESYGWTSGLFLEQFTVGLADELWFPLSPREVDTEIATRPLLARRACYAVHAFFRELNVLLDPRLKALIRSDETSRQLRKGLNRTFDAALSEIQGEGDSVLPDWMVPQPEAIAVGLDRDLASALKEAVEREQGWE